MLVKLKQVEQGDKLCSLNEDVAHAELATDEEVKTLIPDASKAFTVYDYIDVNNAIYRRWIDNEHGYDQTYAEYLKNTGKVPWDVIDCSYLIDATTMFWPVDGIKYAPKLINTDIIETLHGLFMTRKDLLEVQPFDNLSSCENIEYIYEGCFNLKEIPDFPPMAPGVNCGCAFHTCRAMKHAPKINSRVGNAYHMFYGCTSLTTVPEIDLSLCTDMDCMFNFCPKLVGEFPWAIDLSSITEPEKIEAMFSLTGITKVTFKNVPQIFNPDNPNNKLAGRTLGQWANTDSGVTFEATVENYLDE